MLLFLTLSFLFFSFPTFLSQCTNTCVCDNYSHDENTNFQCSNDNHCQCNGTRMCSSYGYCNACDFLALCPSIITSCQTGTYQNQTLCISCDAFCTNCSGPSACSACVSGKFLLDGNCSNKSGYISSVSSNIDYTNPDSSWMDSSSIFCPDETWAIGFNLYSYCAGLGTISMKLFCGDSNAINKSLVAYVNEASFDGPAKWQNAKICSGVHLLKG